MNKTWWKEAVVYQIYPRSFQDSNGDGIGDLNGIRQRLDYLKRLGIDVIWLSPVCQSPNDDNGYDISNYQDIMNEFGSMKDFDDLLREAHEKGIKILLDLVVNHTSDEHSWFLESRKGRENPYRDYYIWKEGKEDGGCPNNWGSCFSGSAWEYDSQTQMYYLHLFSKKQPDLNWENPKVRDEVFEMMDWWCEKGIDGFRMDVISMISKDQAFPDGEVKDGLYGDFTPYSIHGPRVHEYLKEMNRRVLSKYDLMTVGETAGVTIEEAKKYAGEAQEELNMVFHFEHVESDGELGKWTDQKPNLLKLKQILSKWQIELENSAWNSLYWDNHDQPRAVSRFGNDSSEFRELSAKMLATCLHMMKGTPYIYQGEELGMTNYPFSDISQFQDIESKNAYEELVGGGHTSQERMMEYLRCKSRDNARTPMQWNDKEQAGFTNGIPWLAVNPNFKEINADQQIEDPASVFSYYKKLIALRKKYDVIVYGDYELILPEDTRVFAYIRSLGKERILVICNFTEQEVSVTIPEIDRIEEKEYLIHNYKGKSSMHQGILKPYEAAAIYWKKK
ncbi:glycoside hydrolase family 13 protein [Lacrimispora algidixylanolytica]|uniref:Glucohydrolase n=1 Tax=Lacrimispora algidixylanolytica TaxID=94868 RepID=A0A419T012_9FIRM|nr:alpha-glucosidase [Lacrimispora algidixylanolytica]RKD30884.1 glucohydrolase [Lacrimispora algidixylanolytica]